MIACGTGASVPSEEAGSQPAAGACGDASCDPHSEACLTQTLLHYGSDASASTYTCISGSCDPIRCDCIDFNPYEQTTSPVSCGCTSTDAGVAATCTSYAGCYGSPPTRIELLG